MTLPPAAMRRIKPTRTTRQGVPGFMVSQLTSTQATVGEIVAEFPDLGRIFENLGIDYCSRGNKPLEAACRREGINPQTVLAMLRGHLAARSVARRVDLGAMSLGELADHIACVHHEYLRDELPRLEALCDRVARAYAGREPRLNQVREVLAALAGKLSSHIDTQERGLFPAIKRLETGDGHGWRILHGSLANPIRELQAGEDGLDLAMRRLRDLTDGFRPPPWGCNGYRVLLDGLDALLRDMHLHFHKENDVLFPRALKLDAQRRSAPLAT
jgi:regulator of cell morphogenesis and NO signaling